MVAVGAKSPKTAKRGDAHHFISANEFDNYHTKLQTRAIAIKNRTEKGQSIKTSLILDAVCFSHQTLRR